MKPIQLTAHATERLAQRRIAPEWLEAAIREPERTDADPRDPSIERRYHSIPQNGGRILRVACVETPDVIRVITAMFDRGAPRS
jgi:hypothetical protein